MYFLASFPFPVRINRRKPYFFRMFFPPTCYSSGLLVYQISSCYINFYSRNSTVTCKFGTTKSCMWVSSTPFGIPFGLLVPFQTKFCRWVSFNSITLRTSKFRNQFTMSSNSTMYMKRPVISKNRKFLTQMFASFGNLN